MKIVCQPSGEHRRLIKLPLHKPLSMREDRDDRGRTRSRKVGVEVLEGEVQEGLLQA